MGKVADTEVFESTAHICHVVFVDYGLVNVAHHALRAIAVFHHVASLCIDRFIEVHLRPDYHYDHGKNEPANAHASLQRYFFISCLSYINVSINQRLYLLILFNFLRPSKVVVLIPCHSLSLCRKNVCCSFLSDEVLIISISNFII